MRPDCVTCHAPLTEAQQRRHSKYCGKRCRPRAYIPSVHGLPTATVGAMNELLVAYDLMSRGHAVFRALSPSCPCDLAILKNGVLRRIEVTTGVRYASGHLSFPPHKSENFEVMAIVVGTEIIYRGDL